MRKPFSLYCTDECFSVCFEHYCFPTVLLKKTSKSQELRSSYKSRAYPALPLTRAFEFQPCYSLRTQGFLTDTDYESVQTRTTKRTKVPLIALNLPLLMCWTSAKKSIQGAWKLQMVCNWPVGLSMVYMEGSTFFPQS